MRSFAALATAAVVAMLCQTTLLPALPLPVMPDLMLVLAVYLGVRHASIGGACGAFLLGYFVDTFSGTLLGLNAFALTVVYAGVHLVARHLWFERGLPVMVIAFFGGFLRDVATLAVGVVAGGAAVWQHAFGWGLVGALASALVAPGVFAAVAWEKRLLGLS